MGPKVYKSLSKFLKEMDDYKAFKKELKLFLLLQIFTQWKNLCLLSDIPAICMGLVIIQDINSQFYLDLFVVYYLRGFIK
jgi:hypothetical protein